MDIHTWDVQMLSDAYRRKEISPVEVTGAILRRIEEQNPQLNAFITILHDEAMESAKKAEQEIQEGQLRGPYHGVPIGLKDLIDTAHVRTTMGSAIYKNHVPTTDAHVVTRLRAAGAVIVGKLNTHQFAYGPTGDHSEFGPVKNPHDHSKMTGGSSSGSGAAVAAGLCYAALGTDTGGSVRIPAALCGIVGMKPTFGRVGKSGIFPLSQTLDHVGPMTRTVRDNALLLGILSGKDPMDPYSLDLSDTDFTEMLEVGVKGITVGVPTNFYFDILDDEVREHVQQAIRFFEQAGARVVPVEIPDIDFIRDAQSVIIQSESYAIHEPLLQNPANTYDEEVKNRLIGGEDLRAYRYIHALQNRVQYQERYEDIFKTVDVIVTPTVPVLALDIDQREIEVGGKTHHAFPLLLRLTNPTNLTGLPSISVPAGTSRSGLPIGMQLIGKRLSESMLYRVAQAWERTY